VERPIFRVCLPATKAIYPVLRIWILLLGGNSWAAFRKITNPSTHIATVMSSLTPDRTPRDRVPVRGADLFAVLTCRFLGWLEIFSVVSALSHERRSFLIQIFSLSCPALRQHVDGRTHGHLYGIEALRMW